MKSKVLLFSLPFLMASCSKSDTYISALGEKDHQGNFTIKWEIFPEKDDDIVEVYASGNDSVFPAYPIKKVNANKFVTVIENADSLGYSFFKLKVGNTFSDVFSNRFFEINDVLNFRDLGGYETADGKRIKWRKVFRSGDFNKILQDDIQDIKALNIKTVIDLRSRRSQHERADKLVTPQRYELYIEGAANDSINEEVIWDRFLRGDAIIFMQDAYRDLLLKRDNEFARFFDLLADENNYPLVFHCSLGKDQSGIAAYFLLRALGVSTEQAEDDYMLSNIGINKTKIIAGASELTESQQEAFTMLTRTDISYLKYGLACVKKSEGSIEEYMEDRLGLTKEKKQKLRSILLEEE